MRILIASDSQYSAFHGQAIFVSNLAEGLAKRGHAVLVVTISDRKRPYQEQQRDVSIEATPSINMGLLHPDVYFPFFPGGAVKQIFAGFRPEIVHIQDHYPLCRNVLLRAKRMRLKTIGTNHFMPENLAPYVPVLSKITPVFKWVLWRWMLDTYNRLDLVTAPSKTAASIVCSRGLRPPVIPVSCGVDVKLFHKDLTVDRHAWRARYGLDPNRKIFFFVGRVDKEKRLDVLLRAVRSINRDDIQLVIAGNGAALKNLKALSLDLNLNQVVHFTGFIPNEHLPFLLNSVDVFVMPSEAELLSIATLEAMACGKPVLAAQAVALPELVTNGVNGFLFRSGDVAEAARFIVVMADQPERWRAMGDASWERAQFHSLDNTVLKYEQLYETVIRGGSISGKKQPS